PSPSARIPAMNLPIDPQILFFAAGLGLGALLAGLALGARFSRRQGTTANALDLTRAELERVRLELHEVQGQNQELRAECAAAGATLASERQRVDEQLTLLRETREALNRDFENLANRIFEDKQASFSRTSKLALDSTVDPLRKEIADFRKKVEDAYEKENAERNQLIGQIQQLKVEAQRIGDDAVQLARALKGDSKMQGNWGEVVLERL